MSSRVNAEVAKVDVMAKDANVQTCASHVLQTQNSFTAGSASPPSFRSWISLSVKSPLGCAVPHVLRRRARPEVIRVHA